MRYFHSRQKVKIFYILRRSARAKRVRITVHSDRRVVLTVPRWGTIKKAEEFFRQKEKWIAKKLSELKGRKVNNLMARNSKNEYLRYKEKARKIIIHKIESFNKIYGFQYQVVSIRNQKTCWGSCSRNKNLNFNYKLLFLPEDLADYIVVHELCHLKELNHSCRFWELVEKSIPNYQKVRRKLRRL